MKIDSLSINVSSKPFIIAEMSGNHNQSLERALEIVEAASKAGVDAIKLQTYTPDTITLNMQDKEFFIKDSENIWKGNSLYNLYSEAYTPWDWHQPIMEKARDLNLICFSSPFDESAVDFLEDLNVPAYKIASFELNHLPLIKKVALTGKPIILSTGMASLVDINEALDTIKNSSESDFALLKCTSTYPASSKNSNVKTIPHMRELFNCEVGLSDHTMGCGASIASIAHGATIIEKHFTLDRNDGGVDSSFSLEPEEMKTLVVESERAWKSLGRISYGPTKDEKNSLKYRRSIYISKDMKAGEKFDESNIKIVRPGKGISPKYFNIILGRCVSKNITKGTALSWRLIK